MIKISGNRIRTLLIALITVTAISLFCVPVFGVLFSSVSLFGGDTDTGTLNGDITLSTTVTGDEGVVNGTTYEVTFDIPGEQCSASLSLTNNTETYLQYYYAVSLISSGEVISSSTTGIESAILVYYNGKFLDTLNGLCAAGTAEINLGSYVFSSENSIDKITFELHTDASEEIYEDGSGNKKSCKVKIVCYAQTANFQKNMFVSSETEFRKAVDDVNQGLTGGTIILTHDLQLSSSYIINNKVDIDLHGKELSFSSGATVTFAQSGMSRLYSSEDMQSGTLSSTGGSIVINGSSAVLCIDDFYYDNSGTAVNVGKLYGGLVYVENYDAAASADMLIEKFEENIGKGIKSGQSVDFLGANYYCTDSNLMASSVTALSITPTSEYTYSSGVITAPTSAVTIVSSITVSGEKAEFKILGDSESVLAEILDNELKHVPDIDAESLEVPKVSYDIFLPIALRSRNASIEWQSSDLSIMDNKGIIQRDATERRVTLTAYIRINGDVYTEQFTFDAFVQNNQTKFEEFITNFGDIVLTEVNPSAGSEVILPLAGDSNSSSPYYYTNEYGETTGNTFVWGGSEDVGFVSLSYSVDSTYNFITVNGNLVYLNQAYFADTAQINVKAKFLNDDTEYTSVINAIIQCGSDTELHNRVFDFVDGVFDNHVDILQNILDTRTADGMANEKGDFDMPGCYMENGTVYYNITYTIPSSDNGAISSIAADADGTFTYGDYSCTGLSTIAVNPEFFEVDDSKIGVQVTITFALDYGNDTPETRILYFDTPGAIHNDSDGFANSSVFYSVKYQVIQQLPASELVYNTGFSVNGSTLSFTTGNYILRRDIEYASTLSFINGTYTSGSTVNPYPFTNKLTELLTWATASVSYSVTDASNVSQTNNARSYVTPSEKAVIKAYMTSLSSSFTATDFETLWNSVTYSPDGVIVEDGLTLNTAVYNIINNNSYTFNETLAFTYFKYNEVIQWATDGQAKYNAHSYGDYPNGAYVGYTHGIVYRDGLVTVTDNEYNILYAYWYGVQKNSGYGAAADFAAAWTASTVTPIYFNQGAQDTLCLKAAELMNEPYNTTTDTGSMHINGSNNSVSYTFVNSLDGCASGLSYFTNLDNLYIYGFDIVYSGSSISRWLPMFSSEYEVNLFFDTLCRKLTGLQTLVMQYCSFKGYSVLDISDIGNLSSLTYLDLMGNSGISEVGSISDLQVADITYLDISGINSTLDYYEPVLATIYLASNSQALLYYTASSREQYQETDTDRLTAMSYLAYLSVPSSLDSDYLQLTSSVIADSSYSLSWKIEEGNPISTTIVSTPENFSGYSTVTSSDSMDAIYVSFIGSDFDYFYLTTSITYNGTTYAKGIYRYTQGTNSGTLTSVNTSSNSAPNSNFSGVYDYSGLYSSFYYTGSAYFAATRANRTTYYAYYNGDSRTIYERRNNRNYYFTSTTNTGTSNLNASLSTISPNSLIQIVVSRPNTSYYITRVNPYSTYSGNIGVAQTAADLASVLGGYMPTEGYVYYTGTTTATTHSSSGYYTNNTLYYLKQVNGVWEYLHVLTVSAVSEFTATSMESILATANSLTAANIGNYYGNYYCYKGGDYRFDSSDKVINSEYIYQSWHLYRLVGTVGNMYFEDVTPTDGNGNYIPIVNITDIDTLQSIALEATASLGAIYYYTGNADRTYSTNTFYVFSVTESTNTYYLRKWDTIHFTTNQTTANIVRIDNDRIYNGTYYAGTGGAFDIVLSAAIVYGGETYTVLYKSIVTG